MHTAWVVATALGVLGTTGGCLGEGGGSGAGLEVAVAPLQLEGITDARYSIVVTNAPNGAGEVVWSRTVTSGQYGDGAGAITYVGTCDAGKRHTVTLTLEALFAGGELSAATYVNPTPVSLEADCLENRDTPVRFDITLMREANQGFFDVAVQFEDIFCSAKLDCQNNGGGDLDLLFNGASRDMTAVLGFACASGESQTFLYTDDLVIDCGGSLLDVRVAPTGLGATSVAVNPNNYLFAAATYRGLGDGGIAYWNVALGLDADKFATMGACTLKTRATASSTAWDQEPSGFPLPPATVYPVIVWDVPLTSATGRVCTRHEVGSDEVAVDYVGYLPLANGFTWSAGVVHMQHRLTPGAGGGVVLSAGTPICNPSCVNGTCVADGVCQCGPGWTGARCDQPVCGGGCGTGVCVAPGSCNCAGTGFTGDNCQTDINECASNNGGCEQDCDNQPGSFVCTCTVGYTLNVDGSSCDDDNECDQFNGGCEQICVNAPGTYDCACNSGYELDVDNASCVDIDECANNNGGCAQTCHNTPGARTCGCAAGYTLNVNGTSCDDVNECLTNNGGCGANEICTNTVGGRTCGCVNGTYDHNGDGNCETYANCWDIFVANPSATSGTYTVDPDGTGAGAAFQVYCDMTTDGGGWTLLLNQTDTTMRHILSNTGEIANLTTPGAHHKAAGLIQGMTEIRYTDLAGARFLQAYIHGPTYWSALQQTTTSNPVPVAYVDGPLSGGLRHIEVRNVFHWGHRHNLPTWNGISTGVTDYDSRSCLHTCWEDVNSVDRAFAGDHCPSAGSTSFCPGTAANYTFPASSTRGGTFNYRKWVRSRTPATCLEWRVLGYTGSGSYNVDPDGPAGPIAPLSVYCDMSWDGGGWTLLRSTLSTNCLGSEGPVAASTASYLPTATMQAFANRSAQVHIRTRDQAATRSATSTRNTLAIQNLRQARVLNTDMPMSTGAAPTSEGWFGPMVPTRTWYGCGPVNSPWPYIYHAGCNSSGLHLTPTQCRWVYDPGPDENLEVYVR